MNVQATISNILRIGAILSISLIAIGITITHIRHPEFRTQTMPLKEISQVAPVFPHTFSEIRDYMEQFRGRGFVVAGALILILTPIAATFVSIIAYAKQKDRAFVLISTAILLILLLGFYIGRVS